MVPPESPYFANHDRRTRFPWSLYHRELSRRLATAIASHGSSPRVLVVGCGLEPFVDGGPPGAIYHGCDVDARAIDECRQRYPAMADRLAVSRSPLELPAAGAFADSFDVVLAKEVIEHLPDPIPWAQALARRVTIGGELLLTTPNYGRFSTLPLLERTVLEWIARRDGYKRDDIHPSRFDRDRLAALPLDAGMALIEVRTAFTGWTLFGRWRRISPPA